MFLAPSPPAAVTASRGTPYLFTHRNSPAFRIRIPAELQPCLGKTEYRRSLGRCYAREAKLRALRLATAALEVFSFARRVVQARENLPLLQTLINRDHYVKDKPSFFQRDPGGDGGYTPRRANREKTKVAQGQTAHERGYTPPIFQGRELGSLTDEEIRAIAEETLLDALKGINLISLAPIRERILLSPEITGGQEEKEFRAIVAGHGEAMGRGAEKLAASHLRQKTALQRELQRGHIHSGTAQATDTILAAEGIKVDPETETRAALASVPPTASVPYVLTCQEMLKAEIVYHDALAQRAKGNHAAYDATVERLEERQEKRRREKKRIKVAPEATESARTMTTPATPAPEDTPQPPKLSDALKQFLDEREREKWSSDSRRRAEDKYQLFQAIVDPEDKLPINHIGAEHLRRYKKIMFGIPNNRTKIPPYSGMTLPAILVEAEAGRIPEQDRMKTTTIINHCQMISSFLHWAATNEYHSNSAITGLLKIDKPDTSEEEERDPYTETDISKLFSPSIFLTAGLHHIDKSSSPDSGGRPSRFWIPLLGLFTGARLEELAQLHIDDIVLIDRQRNSRRVFSLNHATDDGPEAILAEAKEREETLCLSISANKKFQRLKNKASRRVVPLSPILTEDLNFLGYVAEVCRQAKASQARGNAPDDNGRLFPELRKTPGASKYGHKVTHWYSTYRKRAGIVSGKDGEGKKVFHSFRHTISDWCVRQGSIQYFSIANYLGHKNKDITVDTYSKGTAPHVLYEMITVPFSEYVRAILDIEGLKAGHWTMMRV